MGRLEAATERLSQNVVGLSTSLAMVTEITQRQTQIETRTAEAENKAIAAAQTTTQVQSDLLTLHEAHRRERIGAAIVVVIFLALLAYVRYESVSQIKDRNKVSYEVCQNTNLRVETQADIVQRAGDRPDADKLRSQKTDCDKAYGPRNTPGFFG